MVVAVGYTPMLEQTVEAERMADVEQRVEIEHTAKGGHTVDIRNEDIDLADIDMGK